MSAGDLEKPRNFIFTKPRNQRANPKRKLARLAERLKQRLASKSKRP